MPSCSVSSPRWCPKHQQAIDLYTQPTAETVWMYPLLLFGKHPPRIHCLHRLYKKLGFFLKKSDANCFHWFPLFFSQTFYFPPFHWWRMDCFVSSIFQHRVPPFSLWTPPFFAWSLFFFFKGSKQRNSLFVKKRFEPGFDSVGGSLFPRERIISFDERDPVLRLLVNRHPSGGGISWKIRKEMDLIYLHQKMQTNKKVGFEDRMNLCTYQTYIFIKGSKGGALDVGHHWEKKTRWEKSICSTHGKFNFLSYQISPPFRAPNVKFSFFVSFHLFPVFSGWNWISLFLCL